MFLAGATLLAFVLAVGVTPFAYRGIGELRTLPSGGLMLFNVGLVAIAAAAAVSYISFSEGISPAWIPCVIASSWLVGMLTFAFSTFSGKREYERREAALTTLRQEGSAESELSLHIRAWAVTLAQDGKMERAVRVIIPPLILIVVIMWILLDGVDW